MKKWKHIPALLYAGLLGLTLWTGEIPLVQAGNYDGVNLPSLLPTAYQDAQISVEKKKTLASTSTDHGAAEDLVHESDSNLNTNLKTVMNAGNFGSVGLLFGPTSGNSKVDAYGSLTSSMSLDGTGMGTFDENTGRTGKVYQYHAFGLAMTHLKDAASKTPPEAMAADGVVGALENIARAFSRAGISFIQAFNPLPVVAALYDSSVWTDAAYTDSSGGKPSNLLLRFLGDNPQIKEVIQFFGDPLPLGSVTSMSRAMVFTCILVFLSFGYAAFLMIWNGRRAGITLRKSLLKFVVAMVGLPLISIYGSKGVNWVVDTLDSKQQTVEAKIVSNNLNIYNWYKNAAFGLPNGTSLTVKDGYFQFTPDLVKAINLHASTNKNSASGTTSAGDSSASDKGAEEIANEIKSMAKVQGNLSKITFTPSYGSPDKESAVSASAPWDTTSISTFADALGRNKKYEPKDKKLEDNPYVDVNGLTASGSGTTFTYTGNGQYGISPMAAFNLMATNFSESGFVVKTNTSDIYSPTIAANVIHLNPKMDAEAKLEVPAIVRLVVLFTAIGVSAKALFTVLMTAFAGLGKGGAGTAFGSVASFGTMIGGVLALTAGMVGLSFIISAALSLIDTVWNVLGHILLSDSTHRIAQEVSGDVFSGFTRLPIIGAFLTGVTDNVMKMLMAIGACLMLPQFIKMPIVAYGEWVASWPSALAERFRNWERTFTGDYRMPGVGRGFLGLGGGGGHSGGGGGAVHQLTAAEAAKRHSRVGAMKTGAAMMGGAGLAYLGNKMVSLADRHDQALQSSSQSDQATREDSFQDTMAPDEAFTPAEAVDESPETRPETASETMANANEQMTPQEALAAEQLANEIANEQADTTESLAQQTEAQQTEAQQAEQAEAQQADASDSLAQQAEANDRVATPQVQEVPEEGQAEESLVSSTPESAANPTEGQGGERLHAASMESAQQAAQMGADQKAGQSLHRMAMDNSQIHQAVQAGKQVNNNQQTVQAAASESPKSSLMSRMARGAGGTMIRMSGQALGDQSQGKHAASLAGAGALHALGGLTGTQSLTGYVAQRQLDNNAMRFRSMGMDVPTNLSTHPGESRRDIQRRADQQLGQAQAAYNNSKGQRWNPRTQRMEYPDGTPAMQTMNSTFRSGANGVGFGNEMAARNQSIAGNGAGHFRSNFQNEVAHGKFTGLNQREMAAYGYYTPGNGEMKATPSSQTSQASQASQAPSSDASSAQRFFQQAQAPKGTRTSTEVPAAENSHTAHTGSHASIDPHQAPKRQPKG